MTIGPGQFKELKGKIFSMGLIAKAANGETFLNECDNIIYKASQVHVNITYHFCVLFIGSFLTFDVMEVNSDHYEKRHIIVLVKAIKTL